MTEIIFLGKDDKELIYCAGCGAIRDGYELNVEYYCRHCGARYMLLQTKD